MLHNPRGGTLSVYPIFAEDALGFWRRPQRGRRAIAALQHRRLRCLVAHAAREVPFYRRLFDDARVSPTDIRRPSDLARIPLPSKQQLRDAPLERRVARGLNPAKLIRLMTSGSTGEPMAVLRTRAEEALVHAYQLRSQLMCGVPLRARRAKVGKKFEAEALHRWGVLPTISIDPLQRAPAEILDALRAWRADLLDLRPGVLEILVTEAENQRRREWPWRWLVCGGEMLYPDLRQRAEEIFGAVALERYGAHETGQIAWRCPSCGRMHVNDDSVVVEVLRDGRPAKPGESGAVYVTGLLSHAMPILRHPLDDVVRLPLADGGGCRFGLSALEAVEGRRLDNLLAPDGRAIPTHGLMAALRQTTNLTRFLVIQETLAEIRIRYVAGADDDPASELYRRAKCALPHDITIRVERVEEIADDASGKRRYIRGIDVNSSSSSR